MATITDKNVRYDTNPARNTVISSAATTSDSVDLTDLPTHYPHCFLGIKMFDGAGAQIAAGVATGTFTITVETENSGVAESPPTATIDANAPVTIDWAGNTQRVTVTGSALSGLTTWQVYVTMNRS